MRPWTDGDIDRLIDDTARAMTAGDARADLAARVRSRLEAPRRRSAWTIVAPLAAAAAILIVVFVGRRPRVVAPERAPAPVARSSAPAATGPATPAAPALAHVRDVRARPAARRAIPREPIRPGPIDALAPPPLDVSPVPVSPVLVAPLEGDAPLDIRELRTASIDVAPLATADPPKEKP